MSKRSPENFSPEETGNIRELGFLGTIKETPQLKEAILEMGGDAKTGYLPYEKAIKLVKGFQPWGDPTNPAKDFLRELRIAVIEALDVKPGEEDKIKIYTARGRNPLDVFHGVDAFIEMEEKNKEGKEQIRRVTIDVSENPAKAEGYKADIIASGIPDPSDDEDRYVERIEEIGQEIAERFQSQSRGGY